MSNVLKVAIPSFNSSVGSERIPFYSYTSYLKLLYNVEVLPIHLCNQADVVFAIAGTGLASRIRDSYPEKKIFLFKPHTEIGLCSPGLSLFQRIYSSLYYRLILRPSTTYYHSDLSASSLLVCDTPRLYRHFRSKGFAAAYCPLLEYKHTFRFQRLDSFHSPRDELTILYHGNMSHLLANICDLVSAISASPQLSSAKITLNAIFGKTTRCLPDELKSVLYKVPYFRLLQYHYSDCTLENLLASCDIGWAPGRFSVFPAGRTPLAKLLFTSSTLLEDLFILEKQSSNAGRALVFAMHGIPFLTHPNEESTLLFGDFYEDLFYEDSQQLTWQLQKMLNLAHRNSVSENLVSADIHGTCAKTVAETLYYHAIS